MACIPVAVDSRSLRQLPSIPFQSDPSRLAALLLLVCAACPVSVSVRLACVGRTRSTRDPGHHSRFVQCFLLLLAAAAPALGFDGASCGNSTHRVEPIPNARGCAGCARGQTTPVGERAGDEPRCAVVRCDAPGSSSLGCGTGKIGWKPAPLRACAQRHYRQAASDAAVAADELPQERGRGLAQGSRRMVRFSTRCCREGRELLRHAQRWTPRRADAYEYLQALRPPAFRR